MAKIQASYLGGLPPILIAIPSGLRGCVKWVPGGTQARADEL